MADTPEFTALMAEVTRAKTIDEGSIALINKLFALRQDPAKLVAVVTELKNSNDAVAAALVANTPEDSGTPPTETTPGNPA